MGKSVLSHCADTALNYNLYTRVYTEFVTNGKQVNIPAPVYARLPYMCVCGNNPRGDAQYLEALSGATLLLYKGKSPELLGPVGFSIQFNLRSKPVECAFGHTL